jgi:hypothetical protein
MVMKHALVLGSCLTLLVLYYVSLTVLTFHWDIVLAAGLIGVGIVSWLVLGYWLVERLTHQG